MRQLLFFWQGFQIQIPLGGQFPQALLFVPRQHIPDVPGGQPQAPKGGDLPQPPHILQGIVPVAILQYPGADETLFLIV